MLSRHMYTMFTKQSFKSKLKSIMTSDIDECADETLNICGENTICENVPETYNCWCLDGYMGDAFESCTGMLYI